MKKIIYAPMAEKQIIYIDGEIAIINDDKVIYINVKDITDMLYLFMILDEWKVDDIYKARIIELVNYLYDKEHK